MIHCEFLISCSIAEKLAFQSLALRQFLVNRGCDFVECVQRSNWPSWHSNNNIQNKTNGQMPRLWDGCSLLKHCLHTSSSLAMRELGHIPSKCARVSQAWGIVIQNNELEKNYPGVVCELSYKFGIFVRWAIALLVSFFLPPTAYWWVRI